MTDTATPTASMLIHQDKAAGHRLDGHGLSASVLPLYLPF
jgi:hypothetical protein